MSCSNWKCCLLTHVTTEESIDFRWEKRNSIQEISAPLTRNFFLGDVLVCIHSKVHLDSKVVNTQDNRNKFEIQPIRMISRLYKFWSIPGRLGGLSASLSRSSVFRPSGIMESCVSSLLSCRPPPWPRTLDPPPWPQTPSAESAYSCCRCVCIDARVRRTQVRAVVHEQVGVPQFLRVGRGWRCWTRVPVRDRAHLGR